MTNEGNRTLLHSELTDKVLGVFYDTYNELGHGFPEFVCRAALAIALTEANFDVAHEVLLPVTFRGRRIATFRADIVVNGLVLIEVKIAPQIERVHQAQVLHYLKASGLSVGLLLNFGPRPAFKRVVYHSARRAHIVVAAGPSDAESIDGISQAPGGTGGGDMS